MEIKVVLDEGAYMPVHGHGKDAGYDLKTPQRIVIRKGESVTIDTGVHMEIPEGYYGKLESKSGLNVKHNIVSCGGVIDSGYTGSIAVKLYNMGGSHYIFNAGDKIIQIIVQKHETLDFIEVDTLDETERGNNGFGSTGV